jgi:hypothetical protein
LVGLIFIKTQHTIYSIMLTFPKLVQKNTNFLKDTVFSYLHQEGITVSSFTKNQEIAHPHFFIIGHSLKKHKKATLNDYFEISNGPNGVYLPQYGYFCDEVSKVKAETFEHYAVDSKNQKSRFFVPQRFLANTKIEVPIFSDNCIAEVLSSDAGRNKTKLVFKNFPASSEVFEVLSDGFYLISATDSKLSKQFEQQVRSIVLFNSPSSHCFSALEHQGMMYLGTDKKPTLLWGVDTMLHEFFHIYLNAVLLNIEEFFTIDPYAEVFMSPLRSRATKRGLFHVTHALYVIAGLCNFYSRLLQKTKVDSPIYYDILGRLLMNHQFLKRGIPEIDYDEIFTVKGRKIIQYFQKTVTECENKHSTHIGNYKVPFDSDNTLFDLDLFLSANGIN